MSFPYRVAPLVHQRTALNQMARWPHPYFALLMEQGTGKTFVAICHTAAKVLKGELRGMLIIAPRGVHTNWVRDELPLYMPIEVSYDALLWQSGRQGQSSFQGECAALLQSQKDLAVLAVNTDALKVKGCRDLIKKFLKDRPTIGIIDESSDIASPSSARGRKARLLTSLLAYRLILDGTPWAESPFELYGQFQFLQKRCLGAGTAHEMKQMFGEWEHVPLYGTEDGSGNPRTFPKLIAYKNLDQLAKTIAPFSYRITKQEAMPYLPERNYLKLYFDLAPELRTYYDQMREEYLIEMNGFEATATLVLTRMLRLQQISSGFIPAVKFQEAPDGETSVIQTPALILPGTNERLVRLIDHLQSHTLPAIIWHRFTLDGQRIRTGLMEAGIDFVEYVGSDNARHLAVDDFQSPTGPRVLLANPATAGRGLTLTRAHYMYHYSHYFGLRRRLQADDRFHRIGLDHPVYVVDLIGTDTVDERVVASHRSKMEIAQLIANDPRPAHWL